MKKGFMPVLEHAQPCKKHSYSLKEANRIINLANKPNRVQFKRSRKIPHRRYYCQNCHAWHLTSKLLTEKDSSI